MKFVHGLFDYLCFKLHVFPFHIQVQVKPIIGLTTSIEVVINLLWSRHIKFVKVLCQKRLLYVNYKDFYMSINYIHFQMNLWMEFDNIC